MRGSKTVNGVKHEYYYVGSQLRYEKYGTTELYFNYDSAGNLAAIYLYQNNILTDVFFTVTNIQGDVVSIYSTSGTLLANYEYDDWGNVIAIKSPDGSLITNTNHISYINPIRYRGYYFDTETGLYYLQSRYYNPEIGRFLNADSQLNTDMLGCNLYSYCSNNPINYIDHTGHAWYHWAIGAAIVAACAIAVVATAGGAAPAIAAVASVANGVAAATTASTIAAGAFVGSATVYGTLAATAALSSNSVKEFNDSGNWGTVAATGVGAVLGGADGYIMASTQKTVPVIKTGYSSPKKNSVPNGYYSQLNNDETVRAFAKYDNQGRQIMRVDCSGRPHAGVLPHVHYYSYPEQGGRTESVYDLYSNRIG